MDVRVGLWRRLSAEELMLLKCGVGEDSWESLGLQGDQPVHSEGDQLWDFFGRTDAKAETPVLRPPQVKSWLIGKDSDAGRDWGQEEKGATEDEMAGWHHWFDGRESHWTPGVGYGQGGLVCCDSWGGKESDTTERLIWSDLKVIKIMIYWLLELGFPDGSAGKNLPAMQETTYNARDVGLILGWNNLLEKKMATYSTILAWKSHGQKNPPGYIQSMGSQGSDKT